MGSNSFRRKGKIKTSKLFKKCEYGNSQYEIDTIIIINNQFKR